MHPDLAAFLAGRTAAREDSVVWANSDVPMRITCYRDTVLPPRAFITSVRCLLRRDGAVLVQQDRTATHILPGGQREADEPPAVTLRREVLEETGWTVSEPHLLGFMHFHDPNPAPPNHPYPHPDFVQVVYTAEANAFQPDAKLHDGYELSSVFLPIAEVRNLPLSARERFFLDATME